MNLKKYYYRTANLIEVLVHTSAWEKEAKCVSNFHIALRVQVCRVECEDALKVRQTDVKVEIVVYIRLPKKMFGFTLHTL